MIFQFVNHLFAASERGFAVVAADGDDDGDITDGKMTDAVVKGDGVEAVVGLCFFGNPRHFFYRHRGVALEIQVGNRLALIMVTDRSDEEDDATTGRILNGSVGGVDAQWLVG